MEQFASGRNPIIIFCDGACSGNPGPGGWGTIVLTPEGVGARVRELGGGLKQTTNNRMELVAALRGLQLIQNVPGEVDIYTDSVYVIRGTTQWIWGWRQRGWKTADGQEVANRELWEELSRAVSARRGLGALHWHFVRGHSGIPGNERVDEIAVAFVKGTRVQLYDGPLVGYGVAIHDIPADTSLPEMKAKPEKKAAHSYLSVIDGVPMRHKTWIECERRVKGRSGAKFKKTTSAEDETAVLQAWGLSPDDLT